MPFQTPTLDDRTFQDIVDEAKRRIPLITPEWTDHNLSDPGVALIELFAWMTESIIFRLNQVPDRLYTKYLELLGLGPFPPQPATTDLTFWLSTSDTDEHVIPAGTLVGTLQREKQDSVVFMTEQPVLVRQPDLAACLTFDAREHVYRDRLSEWNEPGNYLQVFPSVSPGDAIYWGFEKSLAGNVLYLDVTAEVHGTGIYPGAPPLAWEVWTGTAWEEAEMDPGGDRTGGLNRDGSILLYLPYRHARYAVHSKTAYWLRARYTTDWPTYFESPTIDTIDFRSLGGRAPARHAEPVGREFLGTSSGKPGQEFAVRFTPVLDRNSDETVEIEVDGVDQVWEEVDDFAHSTEQDQHFTWDSASGMIRFGPLVKGADGHGIQHGATPPEGARVIATGYRHGGGTVGNVEKDSLVVIKSSIPFVQRAQNRTTATGGVDAETEDNAKIRGPMTLVTGERAVTTADFERLALDRYRTLARARCLPADDKGDPIELLLVPHVHDKEPRQYVLDDFTLNGRMVRELAAFLDERRLLGTRVEIRPPWYEGVSVVVRVNTTRDHVQQTVEERCLDALYRFINPLTGGDGKGWLWGEELTTAMIDKLLSPLEGVHSVADVLLFRSGFLDGVHPVRSGVGQARLLPQKEDTPGRPGLFVSGRHFVLTRDVGAS